MPYTKRMPHYGSPKELISYILDKKHDGEKVAAKSSINCKEDFALLDFITTQKDFEMKGNRVAYHIIQSFSPNDNITPEQANEIGKRLCKELYPDFQCLICTHVDKGHIHNHIAINSISLKGKKLDDRLANPKEGLYGLSDASDKIASEYGCYILPKRTFSKTKNENYYHQYKEQSWKQKIKEDVEDLIIKCSNIDEMLEELSILGYEIKRGKHIAVKITGMQKYARLSTIDERYSEQNLNNYYKYQNNIILAGIRVSQNKFNSELFNKAKESKIALEKSMLSTEGKIYNEYQKTRYQEVKRYYQLKQQLEYLDKYNIKSFDDIESQINNKRTEIKSLNKILKKNKKDFDEIIEKTNKAQDYIKLFKEYQYMTSYKEMHPDYVLPVEAEIFLNLQKELNINSVNEAKQIIIDSKSDRIEINKIKQEVLNLQRELNHLDTIKEEKLSSSNLFIHNIKFGGNHIDYKNSNDECFCVNLPYTKEKIYIPKKYTAFNEKYQYYTMYLVDDKEYKIYDKDNKLIGNITGTELEKYVLDKKKEIDKLYSQF